MKVRLPETTRLHLRPIVPDDAEKLYLLNRDADVMRYTGDLPFASEAQARTFVQNYDAYKTPGMGRMAVIRKEDSSFLGWCGLKYSPDKDEYDLGFRFFKKYWNRGYATEAAYACLELGFDTLKLHTIIGNAREENLASIRVLEKIGMRHTRSHKIDGTRWVCYTIYHLEWVQKLPGFLTTAAWTRTTGPSGPSLKKG